MTSAFSLRMTLIDRLKLIGRVKLVSLVWLLLIQPAYSACVFDGSDFLEPLPLELQTLLGESFEQSETLDGASVDEASVCRGISPIIAPPLVEGRALPPAVTGQPAPQGRHVLDEVLVVVRGGRGDMEQVARDYGLEVRSFTPMLLLGGVLVRFGIPDERPVADVEARLWQDPLIMMAAPNHLYDLSGAGFQGRYSAKLSGLRGAHKIAQGKGVKIAIIDTGVQTRHPGLSAAVVARFDGLDQMPLQTHAHGTAVALLMAGRGPAFLGAAPKASLYIARAFDKGAKGAQVNSVFALLASLDWALLQQVDVVNMSFAGPPNQLLEMALQGLIDDNVILVAAAGNGGNEAPPAFPGAYEGVFAVTAVDAKQRIYQKANQGDYVFAALPGVDLMMVDEALDARLLSGTSYGAALFSGIAGLVLENMQDRDIARFRGLAAKSVLDLGEAGRDRVFGHGMVQADRLLELTEDVD